MGAWKPYIIGIWFILNVPQRIPNISEVKMPKGFSAGNYDRMGKILDISPLMDKSLDLNEDG